ncbi:coiled-coil domain-containing protein 102A-like [Punica granatum]|uniref:Uncharacterized protein n=2 Tax=Punica granatum TaxID=22663 RepID=A0A218XVZ0_PUNGR|nr:coiled-coil domain-containing protein 102A-like [Punica granatum]OWM88759.1 hypothetical protein CDL15_Pgr002526 [Punica granatum]PKI55851.1 hypothetical protein CRG98_023732 [Punica granatum]
MKITGRPTVPANTPAPAPPKSPNLPPHPDLLPSKASQRPPRRRTRLRRAGPPTGKRSSRPETPLLKWKTDEGERNAVSIDDDDEEDALPGAPRRRRRRDVPVSARKLAAVLWRLNLPDTVVPDGGGGSVPRRSGEEAGVGHVAVPYVGYWNGKIFGSEAKDPVQSPSSVSGTRNGFLYKLEPSFQFSNSAMEGVTKWDPISSRTSEEARQLYTNVRLLDRQVGAASVISSLEAELEQARARIIELETERRTSKKKLEHFLKKVSEEKAAWRRREHEKIRAFIDDMKSELSRERKGRQRMEIVNSKLVDELAEAKLSAKRYMQDYEKERKTREMIEEVCDELVKEMGEDKAEFEELKKESMKFRDEVEEERKMLQMAEVWREERVQMKLVDAKVALEEKYSQMNRLVADLEKLLSKLRNSNPEQKELRESEFLRQAAASVNIQEIKEFSYEPPNLDDIFAVLEEVNFAENNEREIEACIAYSPASKIHTVSPEVSVIRDQKGQRHSHAFLSHNKGDIDDDESGWETVSNLEDQGSSYSPEGSGSAPSVNKNRRDSNVSRSGTETPVTEISEVCSVPAKQLKKASSIARLWRSCPNNGETLNYKVVSVEGLNNGRLSNARISNGGGLISPDCGSGKGGYDSPGGQWSSPETGNPHVTRAMKGCIEWPRGAQKNSLKAKLLEARMESQKVQLRQVLKQKM